MGNDNATLTAEIKFGDLEHKGPLGLSNAKDKESDIVLMGGDSSNPTWEEYIDGFVPEYHSHLEVAKLAIVEYYPNSFPAAMAVANDLYIHFNDGGTLAFSYRAWGDFIQAIVDKREGYMAYY